jgi:hypothetical protein
VARDVVLDDVPQAGDEGCFLEPLRVGLGRHEGLKRWEDLEGRLVRLLLEFCVGVGASGDSVDEPVPLGADDGGDRFVSIHVGDEVEECSDGLLAHGLVVGGSEYLLVPPVEEAVAAACTHFHLGASDAWRGMDIKKVGSPV